VSFNQDAGIDPGLSASDAGGVAPTAPFGEEAHFEEPRSRRNALRDGGRKAEREWVCLRCVRHRRAELCRPGEYPGA
jgi:hypothetical protein